MMLVSRALLNGLTIPSMVTEVNAKLADEGKDFQVTYRQVERYAALVRAEWQKQRRFNVTEAMNQQLDRLLRIECEASEAWERSKQIKRTIKQTNKSSGAPVLDAAKRVQFSKSGLVVREDSEETLSRTETEQAGDPRFLEILLRCWRERNDLFGFTINKEPEDMRQLIQRQFERAATLRAQVEALKQRGALQMAAGKTGTYEALPEQTAGGAEGGDGSP